MRPTLRTLSRRAAAPAGFTLPEIVLTIAVLAILVTVTAAPLYEFIRQRDAREEHNIQDQLQKALQAYSQKQLSLPTDFIDETVTDTAANCTSCYTTNWFVDLARYTNYSPNQLRFDVWGNERRYILYSKTVTMLGNPVTINYATIISGGPNGKAELAFGIPLVNGGVFQGNSAVGGNWKGFADATDNNWWKAQPNPDNVFAALQPGGDDIMLRFTDYSLKTDKYNLTLDRLNKIADGLQTYARAKYAEAVVAGDTTAADNTASTPDKTIFYPYTYSTDESSQATDTWASYSSRPGIELYAIVHNNTDANTTNPGAGNMGWIYNGSDNSQRRYNMVYLMRLLGLPDEFCCNALSSFVDPNDGQTYEMPFYYASNPRARLSGGACGNRPVTQAASNNVPLPARISTLSITQAGTCY